MEGEKEKLKKLVELKARLEKQIKRAEAELEDMRILTGFLDEVLVEKGFRRAEAAKPTVMEPPAEKVSVLPPAEFENVIPLKMITGESLAEIYVGKDFVQVIPAEEQNFNVNTPPFMAFLVERVLTKMQEKDREAARAGRITPDKILSYNIVRDGDMVRKIVIENVPPHRRRELKSSIRWTFEKMYEKMGATS